jgi:hypothetical protein
MSFIDVKRREPHAAEMRTRSYIPAIVASLGALASAPAEAETTANTLCDFVQQVLAAKLGGFDALKGEAQNPALFKNEVFHGALLPNPQASCTLFLKSQAGRVTLPPRYSCTLAQASDFATATRVFARTAQELRACLPQAMFSAMYDGDGKNPDDSFDWTLSADTPGAHLELEMSNGISSFADALTQGNPAAPPIAIDLDITDTE